MTFRGIRLLAGGLVGLLVGTLVLDPGGIYSTEPAYAAWSGGEFCGGDGYHFQTDSHYYYVVTGTRSQSDGDGCQLTLPANSSYRILAVAGGGGGGQGYSRYGGGGGAGGVYYREGSPNSSIVYFDVWVGAGGAGGDGTPENGFKQGGDGQPTQFREHDSQSRNANLETYRLDINVYGGGGGGSQLNPGYRGRAGGSSGGNARGTVGTESPYNPTVGSALTHLRENGVTTSTTNVSPYHNQFIYHGRGAAGSESSQYSGGGGGAGGNAPVEGSGSHGRGGPGTAVASDLLSRVNLGDCRDGTCYIGGGGNGIRPGGQTRAQTLGGGGYGTIEPLANSGSGGGGWGFDAGELPIFEPPYGFGIDGADGLFILEYELTSSSGNLQYADLDSSYFKGQEVQISPSTLTKRWDREVIQAMSSKSWLPSFDGLPPGLSLNSATGVISGTPTQTGTWFVGLELADPLDPGRPNNHETLFYIDIENYEYPDPNVVTNFRSSGEASATLRLNSTWDRALRLDYDLSVSPFGEFSVSSNANCTVSHWGSYGSTGEYYTLTGLVAGQDCVLTVTQSDPREIFTAHTTTLTYPIGKALFPGGVQPVPTTSDVRVMDTMSFTGSYSLPADSPASWTPTISTITESGEVCQVTADDSDFGWSVLALTVGTCTLTFTTAEDATVVSGQFTYSFNVSKADQSSILLTGPDSMNVGEEVTITAANGDGTGAFSVSDVQGCTNTSGLKFTASTGGGNCVITIQKAADADYNAATATITIPINLQTPTSSVQISVGSTKHSVGDSINVPITAGSGTGDISIEMASGNCSAEVSGDETFATITVNSADAPCRFRAVQAADANWLGSTSSYITVYTQYQGQTVTFGATSTAEIYGRTISVTPTSSSGLTVQLTSTTTTVCTVSGDTVTFVDVGTCTLQGHVPDSATSASPAYFADTQTHSIAVSKAQLTVTIPLDTKSYDGTTDATFTGADVSLSGEVAGDNVTLNTGQLAAVQVAFTSSDVGSSIAGTVTNTSGVVTYPTSKYDLTFVASGDITKRSLRLQLDFADKTYDGTTAATLSGITFVPGDKISGDDVVAVADEVAAAFFSASVGVGKSVTASLGSGILNGVDAGNYDPLISGTPQATISRAAAVITWAPTTSYNASLGSSFTIDQLATALGDGAITFSVADAGTAGCSIADSTQPVVSFTSDGACDIAANLSQGTNYQAGSNTLTFTLTPGTPQSISFVSLPDVTYGDGPVSLVASTTASGLSVSFSVSSGAVCSVSGSTLRFDAVGSCVVTASQAGDVVYAPAADVTQTVVVSAKVLSLTVSVSDKTYDGGTSATLASASLDGAMAGDDIAVSVTLAFTDANVGSSKSVSVTPTLTGADAANYTVSANSPTASIAAKPITVAVSVADKTYDGSSAATISSVDSFVGAVSGDTVSLDTSNSLATFADATAGSSKSVTVTPALMGADAGNYSVSMASTPTAAIVAKAITVYVTALDKTYDGSTDATVSGLLTGAVSGDDVWFATSSTAVFANASVGSSKPVTVTPSLTGDEAGNYTVTVSNSPTADISARMLTATVSIADKTYDGTSTASITGTPTLDGVITGENVSLDTANSSAVFADAYVGSSKSVTVAPTLTGADAANYSVTMGSTPVASITAKTLTLTVTVGDKNYDGTTEATLSGTSIAGLVGSDTVSVDTNQIVTAFTDRNVGVNKAITVELGPGVLTGPLARNYSAQAGAAPTATIRAIPSTLTWGANTSYAIGNNVIVVSEAPSSDGTGSLNYSVSDIGTAGCSIADSNSLSVSVSQVGTCELLATQAADINHTGGSVTLTITIQPKTPQSISFVSLPDVTYGDGPVSLVASTTASGLSVSFSVSSGAVCSVSGSTLRFDAVGSCVVTASQAGDVVYAPAADVTQTVVVSAKVLSLTVSVSDKTYDGGTSATLASASLDGAMAGDDVSVNVSAITAVFNSANAAANKPVGVAVGAGLLTGSDSSNYTATLSGTPRATINRASQAILTYAGPTNGTFGRPITLTANGGSGNGAISFSVSSGPCTISGSTLTPTSSGNCLITFTKSADTNYLVSAPATQVLAVAKASQSISFTSPSPAVVTAEPFYATASSDSGLSVRFASQTSSVCSINSSTGLVTVKTVGDCTLTASQAGNANYLSATDVQVTFAISAVVPNAPKITSITPSDSAVNVSFSTPSFSGGAIISSYQLVATSAAHTVTKSNCSSSPCALTGLTNGDEYSITVAAANSAGLGSASNASSGFVPYAATKAVQNLTVSSSRAELYATWNQPASFGGGTFVSYVISLREGAGPWVEQAVVTDVTATTYSFTGLANGTAYEIKIAATSTGYPAEVRDNTATAIGLTPAVPAQPSRFTVVGLTDTSAIASWNAPADGGSQILGYLLNYPCDFGSATDTSCTLTGLTPGSRSTITVSARNEVGLSVVASQTVTTTGQAPRPASTATASAPLISKPTLLKPLVPVLIRPNPLTVVPRTEKTGNEISVEARVLGPGTVGITAGRVSLSIETSSGVSKQLSGSITSDPIQVQLDEVAKVSGGGLQPRSLLRISLPSQSGSGEVISVIPVDQFGAFQADLDVSMAQQRLPLPIGRQVFQVSGIDDSGEPTSFDFEVEVNQPPPRPELNRESNELPELQLGETLITNAGLPGGELFVTADSFRQSISMASSEWNLTIEASDTAGVVDFLSDGKPTLTIEVDGTLTIQGGGFKSGTRADVFLFSTPELLASVDVGSIGSFETTFTLDSQKIPPGSHTLQIQAVGTDGYIKATNFGVGVAEGTEPQNRHASLLTGALSALAGFLAIFAMVVMRRRTRRSEPR